MGKEKASPNGQGLPHQKGRDEIAAGLEWLDVLMEKSNLPVFDDKDNHESWVYLEQMENLLRNFTKFYRHQGEIDPLTFEDFADKLQFAIDELREFLNVGDQPTKSLTTAQEGEQLEIAFFKLMNAKRSLLK